MNRLLRWLGIFVLALAAVALAHDIAGYFSRGSRAWQRGVTALERREYDLAIGEFTRTIASGERLADSYVNRGIARSARKQHEEALKDFESAVHADPSSADALLHQGIELGLLGRHPEAIAAYHASLKLRKWPETWVRLGIAQQRLGDRETAQVSFDTALRLKPGYPYALVRRGMLKAEQKQAEAAIRDFTDALAGSKSYADAYLQRGLAHSQLGNYDLAAADYDQVIRIRPDSSDGYYFRAVDEETRKKYEHAEQDFTQALRFDPADAAAYRHRGWVRLCQGKYAEAAGDGRDAIQLLHWTAQKADEAALVTAMGLRLAQRGDEAGQWLEEALGKVSAQGPCRPYLALLREGTQAATLAAQATTPAERAHAWTVEAVRLLTTGKQAEGLACLDTVAAQGAKEDAFTRLAGALKEAARGAEGRH